MSQSRPARRHPTSNRQSRKAVFTRDPGPRREFLRRTPAPAPATDQKASATQADRWGRRMTRVADGMGRMRTE